MTEWEGLGGAIGQPCDDQTPENQPSCPFERGCEREVGGV